MVEPEPECLDEETKEETKGLLRRLMRSSVSDPRAKVPQLLILLTVKP